MKHNDTHGKIKISIRTQFALIFASLMLFTIAFFLITDTTLLKQFYIKDKEKALKTVYNIIEVAADNSTFDTKEFDNQLDNVALKYNIDVIIVDVDSKTVNAKGKDPEGMRRAIWDLVFMNDRDVENDSVIEQNKEYQLLITTDRISKAKFIEMWGMLSNDNIFMMRSAVQSIEETARITNLFLGYTGIVALLVGFIIVSLVARKVSKPILELADISEKMGELDFDARYIGEQNNEIGLLGENINKMSKTLEKTISELKVANIELQRDIEKKDKLEEMRSEFLSNVSHELKTPIALIQGYAEGLVEGVSDDKESRDYYCNVILDEADKMNAMVKKLLTLNELEFGRENVNMERFDIVALIQNRINETKLLDKQKEYDIIFSENESIYVWGDEFKTEEVFTNYFSNAVNHCSGDRKIKISIEKKDDSVARIYVFNTGDKIPEDSIEHLFEKFYKVDKARTRAYGGSGIGLSIVKAIQNSMNQSYGVRNEDNGVTFWFDMELA